jgi:hypothetical protein
MNDDLEQVLSELTPRGVRPELRPRVLEAVASQLRAKPPSRWLRLAALATAASILVAIGLNVAVNRSADRNLAQLVGPPPAHSDGESMTAYYAALGRIINELQTPSKDFRHETPQKGPEMDGRGAGRARGDRSGCQRLVRVDYQYTA